VFVLVTRIVSALALTFNLAAYGFGLIPGPVPQTEKTQVPKPAAPSTSVYDDMLDNLDHSSLSFEAVVSREGDDLDSEMPGNPIPKTVVLPRQPAHPQNHRSWKTSPNMSGLNSRSHTTPKMNLV